jgi:cell division protein ZapA (FtsZ GTPase activity inhibitor)
VTIANVMGYLSGTADISASFIIAGINFLLALLVLNERTSGFVHRSIDRGKAALVRAINAKFFAAQEAEPDVERRRVNERTSLVSSGVTQGNGGGSRFT